MKLRRVNAVSTGEPLQMKAPAARANPRIAGCMNFRLVAWTELDFSHGSETTQLPLAPPKRGEGQGEGILV